LYEVLEQLYPGRILRPLQLNELRQDIYYVYILLHDNNPIVLGHGKRNRARVIFDNIEQITSGHIKALFVRLYVLYSDNAFEKMVIACESKNEASIIEKSLQKRFGGNNRNIPDEIREKLFENLNPQSVPKLLLEIAIRSSFDGLSDIRKWRADNLIDDNTWNEISIRLQLK